MPDYRYVIKLLTGKRERIVGNISADSEGQARYFLNLKYGTSPYNSCFSTFVITSLNIVDYRCRSCTYFMERKYGLKPKCTYHDKVVLESESCPYFRFAED